MAFSFNTLLMELGAEIGVDPDALVRTQELIVDNNVIGMYLDADNLSDSSSSASQMVVFFTLLGNVSYEDFPRVARTLLEANNLWAGTGGCTLGLQRGHDQATLSAQLPLSALDGRSFSVAIHGFCDTANFWRRYIAELEVQHADSWRMYSLETP